MAQFNFSTCSVGDGTGMVAGRPRNAGGRCGAADFADFADSIAGAWDGDPKTAYG